MRASKQLNLPNLAFVVLLGLIAAAGVAFVTGEKRGSDGCPETGPDANAVILLDGSDPIIDSQLDPLRRQIRVVVESLGSRRKLWVFVFGGGVEADLVPVHAACNPVGDRDWTRGKVWEAEQEAAFFRKVEDALRELKRSRKGYSPIIEGSDRLLFMSELFTGQGADLWTYSDLLQNTPARSHFPSSDAYRRPSVDDLPDRTGLPGRKWRSVRLFEIQRPQWRHLQGPASGRFWVELMATVSLSKPVLEKL